MTRLRPIAIVAAGASVLWLIVGHGFANYDALYSLLWGRELAHGQSPQVNVPLAPTSHPLANLVGALLSVFDGRTAEDLLVVLAYVSLAAVGYVVFELARHWFGWVAGVIAAVVLLRREPILSYGIRAYVDVPYLLFVLLALLVEVRRPRAGVPVLALLALAGLLRPEAWLFSIAYLVWLWRRRRPAPAEIALALSAPLLWFGYDLVASGDALRSLHDTRDNTHTLGRATGLQHVPTTLPRRVGEILREPGLAGAVAGVGLGLVALRDKLRPAIAALVLAVVAYAILAAAGLPIITRYAFLIAAIGAVFCGGAIAGWLPISGGRLRTRWTLVAAVVTLLFIVLGPQQQRRLDRTTDAIAQQQRIRDDLYALLDAHHPPAGIVAVANHRLVPLVALSTARGPRDVVTPPHRAASFIGPANATVARRFILDPRDPVPRVARAPDGMREVARNASWVLYAR